MNRDLTSTYVSSQYWWGFIPDFRQNYDKAELGETMPVILKMEGNYPNISSGIVSFENPKTGMVHNLIDTFTVVRKPGREILSYFWQV